MNPRIKQVVSEEGVRQVAKEFLDDGSGNMLREGGPGNWFMILYGLHHFLHHSFCCRYSENAFHLGSILLNHIEGFLYRFWAIFSSLFFQDVQIHSEYGSLLGFLKGKSSIFRSHCLFSWNQKQTWILLDVLKLEYAAAFCFFDSKDFLLCSFFPLAFLHFLLL